jgi:hypothetical protein
MNQSLDAADGCSERVLSEQVALDQLDACLAQVAGTRRLAHERFDLITSLRKTLGEAVSNLSGRSGDEYFHG